MLPLPSDTRAPQQRPTLSQLLKLALLTLGLSLSATSFAQTTVSPESVGLSSERLTRIDDVVTRYMENQHISGAVTAVARNGETVHFSAQGYMDRENQTEMREDAIFRMASMSKTRDGRRHPDDARGRQVETGRSRLQVYSRVYQYHCRHAHRPECARVARPRHLQDASR